MRFLMFLGELALRALGLGTMGTLLAWMVRRRGAETQHTVWRMVLGGMLALPFLMTVLPPLIILPSRAVTSIAASAVSVMHSSPLASPPASFDGAHFNVSFDATAQNRVFTGLTRNFPILALVFYVAIAALLLGRVARAVRRAKKTTAASPRIQLGLLQELGYPWPELRESAGVAVPFTIGRRNPVIVLPANWREWGDFKLRSVLVHELAHIRRDDWATALAAAVNRALFWFHPLAWWLETHLAALAEEACDAAAIQSAGDAARYAKVVLEFAELASLRPVAGTTSMARTSKVGRRIRRILEGRVGLSQAIAGLPWILVLAVALPVVYGAASFRLTGQVEAPLTKSPPSPYSSMSHIDGVRAILADGWKLTPGEAVKLESDLERDPENLPARIRLLSYYTQYMVLPERRATHLLWLIERHPDCDVFQLGTVVTAVVPDYSGLNSPNIERARAAWLRQTERFPANPRVLANAATALGGLDGRIALDLVRRARVAEPGNPEWLDWLAATYATSVRSSFAGGYPGVRAGGSGQSFHTGIRLALVDSDALKRELETSSDAALVGAAAEALLAETVRLTGLASRDSEVEASEALGKQLLLRARQLDPNNPRWK